MLLYLLERNPASAYFVLCGTKRANNYAILRKSSAIHTPLEFNARRMFSEVYISVTRDLLSSVPCPNLSTQKDVSSFPFMKQRKKAILPN